MTTIQVRVKEKTKTKAKKVLDDLGLDISTAVNMYLEQIVREQALPFRPRLMESDLTEEDEKDLLRRIKDAKEGKNLTEPMNIKEAITYLGGNYEDYLPS